MSSVNYLTNDAAGQYFATHPDSGDAWAQLSAILQDRGLGSLSNFIENGIIQGWDAAQAEQHIRETPEWQTRFAAIIQRQKLGLPAISEDDVVNTERQYAQIMQSAGLPAGFYDQPSDFTDLLVKDISPTEVQNRVVQGYQAAMNAPPETKNALKSMYGLNDGDLAAYFLDPSKTEELLTKQVTSAQIAGAAQRTGFGGIDKTQAEGLNALGVTNDQATQGFSDLASKAQLMQTLPGEGGDNIGSDQQLAAEFGQNAAAQRAIKDRGAQRVAAFSGNGTFASNKEGFAGVGKAL